MKRCYPLLIALSILLSTSGKAQQTNIISTNTVAEQVMLGNYNPATYAATTILNNPDTISRGINARVSPDSMRSYIVALSSFYNRNTGADTISPIRGVGAARRWIYNKLAGFSTQNGNRLIPSYLQFDMAICSQPQHRNIFAVLPGMDTSDKSVVIIEGHMDSRCIGVCDTACLAEGAEDNSSGTALVMELARVMSRYTYNHTIVFLVTIGEEQGLYGAEAFANYVQQKGIKVKAVMNSDVVGGIRCGHTASPPGCSGFNTIDSTHVRLFSAGGYNSPHKGLARYVKLEYKEMILPYATVPMEVNIMTPEDRTGRGSDHIPFRQKGYTSIRFCAANESGDGDVTNPNYADRQHTSADVLGVDVNNDQILDTVYVDFNYLARNAVIKGNATGMIGISPRTPDFSLMGNGLYGITVQITQETQYPKYRVGIRTTTNDWDSVYTFVGPGPYNLNLAQANFYIVSVTSVDNNGVESLFSREQMLAVGVRSTTTEDNNIELLQNRPNPFDEATTIGVIVTRERNYNKAYIKVTDVNGREIKQLPITLKKGMNEVIYEHGYNHSGTFVYSLVVDGIMVQSKKMVFAN